ncbi:competence protein CoiA family protein [Nocardia transvalensis]|uniref:competence protein CoiA family protein n=1 Tax=Nocardia transvalensis TaxID=37333 RepID=UPI001895B600|nr:competence protein CoiA family protein [Nocardia transvalensis]MBF6329791.1 hypothetical protein [Nocardia transvalensis]
MGSSNQLVVALDLTRQQYVCAPMDPADPYMQELRSMSYIGDRTLVCALCYIEFGCKVPVIVRGCVGGLRRPHFAHPAGHTPDGGQHHPETVWHLTSKTILADWTRQQPNVIEVRNEVWLPDRERRADVQVLFADGRQVALEIQGYRLTDSEWTSRHRDYQRNGVTDVWLWHPASRPHWIVLNDPDDRQQLWTFDPQDRSIALMIAAPHRTLWPRDEIQYRVRHIPPCIGDQLIPHQLRLDELPLTPDGLDIPTALKQSLATELRHEHDRDQTAWPVVHAARIWAHWIRLQSAFRKTGHAPDRSDRFDTRGLFTPPQSVHCTQCGHILQPDTSPTEVPACRPTDPTRPSSTQQTPALPTQLSATQPEPTPRTQPRSTRRNPPPDPNQLSLF